MAQPQNNKNWWFCKPCKCKIPDKLAPCPTCGEHKSGVSVVGRRLCAVCMDMEPSVVFLPCRHLALCGGCAPRIADLIRPACPICREPIESRLSVFHV